MGCREKGVGCRAWDVGLGVLALGFGAQGVGFRDECSVFRVYGWGMCRLSFQTAVPARKAGKCGTIPPDPTPGKKVDMYKLKGLKIGPCCERILACSNWQFRG